MLTDPSKEKVEMTNLYGGPCDGTEVLKPPPHHRQNHVCIGVPAPPEYSSILEPIRCVYMWYPKKQRYCWLDFLACNPAHVEQILRQICDDMDQGKGFKAIGK